MKNKQNKPVRAALGIIGVVCFIFAIALQMGIGRNTAHGDGYRYEYSKPLWEIVSAQKSQEKIQWKMLDAQKSQAKSLKEIAASLKNIEKRCK
jgi:hypothetical protein